MLLNILKGQYNIAFMIAATLPYIGRRKAAFAIRVLPVGIHQIRLTEFCNVVLIYIWFL